MCEQATVNAHVAQLIYDVRNSAGVSHPFPALKRSSAGMGGLQQTTVNCGEQNIKIEKSPLSTPRENIDKVGQASLG